MYQEHNIKQSQFQEENQLQPIQQDQMNSKNKIKSSLFQEQSQQSLIEQQDYKSIQEQEQEQNIIFKSLLCQKEIAFLLKLKQKYFFTTNWKIIYISTFNHNIRNDQSQKQEDLKFFLQSIGQTSVDALKYNSMYQINILKQISHINFTNLKYLMLMHSWVDNIQSLTFIDLSSLQNLSINQTDQNYIWIQNPNVITRVTSFKKLCLPNLETLCLQQCHVMDMSALDSTNFKLSNLEIDTYYHPKYNRYNYYSKCQDLSKFVKLNFENMRMIEVHPYERIRQEKVVELTKKNLLIASKNNDDKNQDMRQ